MTVGESQTL